MPFAAGMIGKGNGVTLSPDGALLYITHTEGHLSVLRSSTGDPFWEYSPQSASTNPIKCESTVAFGELDGQAYAAYAIIEEAPFGSDSVTVSRIVAVPHPPSGEDAWFVSEPIPGEVQGTPVITQQMLQKGKYVYVTHNVVGSPVDPEEGMFSVITVPDGNITFTHRTGGENSTGAIPYGPLGVAHDPFFGKYAGGVGNTADLVVWGSSAEGGTGRQGNTNAFQYKVNGLEVSTLRSSTRWTTITKPTLSQDGLNLYFTIRASQLRAWVGATGFEDPASWASQLEQVSNALDTPIMNAATLSIDGTRLFVSSATNTFASIEAETGTILWEKESDDVFMTEAKVSPEDNLVYSIQVDGNVQARMQKNGDVFWSTNCTDVGGVCQSPTMRVLGEFSVSESGLTLYYGDEGGNILALQLGSSRFPTIPPSDFPSTAAPSVSQAPSKAFRAPSGSPSLSSAPSPSDTSNAPSEADSPTAAPFGFPTEAPTSSGFRSPLISVAARVWVTLVLGVLLFN